MEQLYVMLPILLAHCPAASYPGDGPLPRHLVINRHLDRNWYLDHPRHLDSMLDPNAIVNRQLVHGVDCRHCHSSVSEPWPTAARRTLAAVAEWCWLHAI